LQWDLLQWDTHRGVQRLLGDLNQLVQREPALHQIDFQGEGFEWIDCMNGADSVLGYIRKAKDPNDFLVVCCNFTPVVREYRMGVPKPGFYREIFNSDSAYYAGSNVGNFPGLHADPHQPHHGRPASISIKMPPLATLVFKPE
jgi:1,4-alpha-glucan branching enzyme